MIRTLRASQQGRYASFPTVLKDGDVIRVFYRLAAKGRTKTHGSAGRVRCLSIAKQHFLQAFANDHPDRLYDYTDDDVLLFGEDNEMDAIASRMSARDLVLTTRTFDSQHVMRNFVSHSSDGVAGFKRGRREIPAPDGVQWFAFFGHAIVGPKGAWWFPAYGCLQRNQDHQVGFILETDQHLRAWRVREILPKAWQTEVNECSVIHFEKEWFVFLRQRRSPFGIWMVRSADGVHWGAPELLTEQAHAPMATVHKGRLTVGIRHILDEEEAATSVLLPLEDASIQDLDTYTGNVYDGGYCDLLEIDGALYAFYYHGNPEGEPELRCALVDLGSH